jgi:hypothetical protein
MSRTWLAVVGISVASAASILVYLELRYRLDLTWTDVPWGTATIGPTWCSAPRIGSGADLGTAAALVAVSGLAAASGVAVARKRPRLLASIFLAEAVALAVGLGLVAADSATWWASHHCAAFSYGPGPGGYRGKAVTGFDWLYLVYGVPFALLFLRGLGAWKKVAPPTLPSRFAASWETGA